MNRNDFRAVMVRLYAIEPAYQQWVLDHAESVAPAMGVDVDAAYENLVVEWLKAVEPYTPDEINAVLDEIAGTHKQLPTYSKLWRTLAGYAADDRQAARDAARAGREREPRFHCLRCNDAGSVIAYNPRFVEWLRPRFLQWLDAGAFPVGWYIKARHEWYRQVVLGQQRAPAEIGLVCNCNCPAAGVFRRQLTAMVESQGAKRAAYIGQYEPKRDCLAASTPQDDLARWYDAHEADFSSQWNPEPGEYERRFR